MSSVTSHSKPSTDRRYALYIGAASIFLILYYLYVSHVAPNNPLSPAPPKHTYSATHDTSLFADRLLAALDKFPPGIPPIVLNESADPLVFWKAKSETGRPDLVHLEKDQIEQLRKTHDGFKDAVTGPEANIHVPFIKGTRGIVSTAGRGLVPVFVISLRMLRRTGCELPVELLVGTPDEEPYLCDTLLPTMNARCIFLSDQLGSRTKNTHRFQFKILAILLSSFQDVLFLDADNFPVIDPTPLFTDDKSPYQSAGLVVWPDFWASSASHTFYEVQSLSVPPMKSHPSSESGQLMVSKKTHAHALLMAAYYNCYGPDFYFQLMGQGANGQGDKETYMAGADVTSASSYRVRSQVDTMGYYEGANQTGQYHGVAMLQYDPRGDRVDQDIFTDDAKRVLFVHHNFPKPDPMILFSDKGGVHGEGAALIDNKQDQFRRLWGPRDLNEQRFGRDVEAEMWEEIQDLACILGHVFQGWQIDPEDDQKQSTTDIIVALNTCGLVKEYRRTIFGGDQLR